MSVAVRNTLIIISSVIIGVFLINFIIQKVSNKIIIKEHAKIERYKEDINKYNIKIISLIDSINQQDNIILIAESKIDSLENTINKLEKEKITKKDGVAIKIQNVNNFSVFKLDSFYTDRFNKIPKDSNNR